jgi:hypothetical protein
MTAAELLRLDLAGLESLYNDTPRGPAPRGLFRGRKLAWVDGGGARRAHVRLVDGLLFGALRFGIDFDRRLWWFVRPSLALGRFELDAGPSRWRDTDTFQLHYQASRLPAPVRTLLYDEVKPLGDDLCLGLGGINAPLGEGDHFFFALTR